MRGDVDEADGPREVQCASMASALDECEREQARWRSAEAHWKDKLREAQSELHRERRARKDVEATWKQQEEADREQMRFVEAERAKLQRKTAELEQQQEGWEREMQTKRKAWDEKEQQQMEWERERRSMEESMEKEKKEWLETEARRRQAWEEEKDSWAQTKREEEKKWNEHKQQRIEWEQEVKAWNEERDRIEAERKELEAVQATHEKDKREWEAQKAQAQAEWKRKEEALAKKEKEVESLERKMMAKQEKAEKQLREKQMALDRTRAELEEKRAELQAKESALANMAAAEPTKDAKGLEKDKKEKARTVETPRSDGRATMEADRAEKDAAPPASAHAEHPNVSEKVQRKPTAKAAKPSQGKPKEEASKLEEQYPEISKKQQDTARLATDAQEERDEFEGQPTPSSLRRSARLAELRSTSTSQHAGDGDETVQPMEATPAKAAPDATMDTDAAMKTPVVLEGTRTPSGGEEKSQSWASDGEDDPASTHHKRQKMDEEDVHGTPAPHQSKVLEEMVSVTRPTQTRGRPRKVAKGTPQTSNAKATKVKSATATQSKARRKKSFDGSTDVRAESAAAGKQQGGQKTKDSAKTSRPRSKTKKPEETPASESTKAGDVTAENVKHAMHGGEVGPIDSPTSTGTRRSARIRKRREEAESQDYILKRLE